MIPVLVGVSAAFIFGAADFMGGMGSRRIAAVRVTFMSGVTGLVLMLIIVAVLGSDLLMMIRMMAYMLMMSRMMMLMMILA